MIPKAELVERNASGLSNAYKRKAFFRMELRVVVTCSDGRREVLWTSDHYDGRSRGKKSEYEAMLKQGQAILLVANQAIWMGLEPDAPAWEVRDKMEDLGLNAASSSA